MNSKMPLPTSVKYIIDSLRAKGYRADVVGGSVRDFLLEREVGDYDITTSARPSEVKSAFSEHRTIDTGIKHGTVTLVLEHTPYEITTYRTDGEYKDNRHPESVEFTDSLAEDLRRRDFTVNALCYNPYDGFTDLHSGVADLKARLIRAVGDPGTRFDEDALRIIRAIRFASVLDFGIEENTAAAIFDRQQLLSNVSAERIYSEFKKLLSGPSAHRVLREYGEVIRVVIPTLPSMTLPSDSRFCEAEYMSRLTSLFMLNCTEPADAFSTAMRVLKTDNSTRTLGERILRAYDSVSFGSEAEVCVALYKHGVDTVAGVLKLGVLLEGLGQSEEACLTRVLEENLPCRISHLAIRGSDLFPLGICGEAVGKTLEALLYAVIFGKCENNKAALLSYVDKIK